MSDLSRRKEVQFDLEWATCGECGSARVYATHQTSSMPNCSAESLRLTCRDCESEYLHMGRQWTVVEPSEDDDAH